jgi:hypothetical protein
MQIFIEVPSDVTEWFERIDDTKSLRDLFSLARKCVVIANHKGDRRALLKSVSQIDSESTKSILEAFVTSLPANWNAGEFDAAFQIGSLGDDLITFDRLKEDGVFDSVEDGNFDIDPGTSREVAFQQNFKEIAVVANSIEIADPYFSRHLVDSANKSDSKLWWFMQLLKNPNLNISIISTCPKEKYAKNFVANLREVMEGFLKDLPTRQGIVRIETFEENSSIFHNRTLRFIFEQNDLAIESNNSFDRYSATPISQRLSLKRISANVPSKDLNFYKTKLRQFESILIR